MEEERVKVRVFLSYSSTDKNLADQVKQALEDYGIEIFLAHEDIEPTSEWVDTILAELKACDIFIPILTEVFNDSDWTDQETGFAIATEKLIIPLKVNVDPHGFISRFQAFKFDINNVENSCFKLAKLIASKPTIGDSFKDALIKKFGDSRNFATAAHNTNLLLSFEGYSRHQVIDIVKHTIDNGQINDCFRAQPRLRSFVYEYKDSVDPDLLKSFYRALED